MSEYILYDISGIQPYYKYDDIVISAEAAEDIRQWALDDLRSHMYKEEYSCLDLDHEYDNEYDNRDEPTKNIIFPSGTVFNMKMRKMWAEELPKSEYDKHLQHISSGYQDQPLS